MEHESMYYRMMGNTGIQVSVISYGFWATYGIKDRLSGDEGVRTAKELMRMVEMQESTASIMLRHMVIPMEKPREYSVSP